MLKIMLCDIKVITNMATSLSRQCEIICTMSMNSLEKSWVHLGVSDAYKLRKKDIVN